MAHRLKLVDSHIIEAAQALVYTSVDDCRRSLYHRMDPAVVETAIRIAETLGHKSRLVLLRRRLKQIKSDTNICIFCECTDTAPCVHGEVPCSWYLLDEKLKKGVCNYCADNIRHFAFQSGHFMESNGRPSFDPTVGLMNSIKWFSTLSGKLPRE